MILLLEKMVDGIIIYFNKRKYFSIVKRQVEDVAGAIIPRTLSL